MAENREVVVVGAGPVGLSLALGLARTGADVLVLEKEPGTSEHSRAPGIWPRTQEILAGLGVLDRFVERSILKPLVEVWDADRKRVLVRLPIAELKDRTPYPRLLILPQSETERLLCEALRKEGTGEIRFCSEVFGISQSAVGVDVRYRSGKDEKSVFSRFVAGCDGAHSTIREEIGGSMTGITYKVESALADIVIESDNDFKFPRLTTCPDLCIAARIDAKVWRLIMPYGQGDRKSVDERIEQAVRGHFPGVDFESRWQSEFSLHRRISTCWHEGRVVLAGDAAHLNSPVGGEGMNAGIIDADMLQSALQEALKTDRPEALAGYAEKRCREIEKGVNRFTDLLTRLLFAKGGRMIRPMMLGAKIMLMVPPLRRRFLRRLAMLE